MVNLSVVIPIYNAHEYVERCARSLMSQTLKENIEFVFIDDCSSDNSLLILRELLEEFPERKSQVRIIENRENLGIYRTRCLGAEIATGNYLGWVDSDDWVDPDMFEVMLEASNRGDIDIVVCDYVEYRNDRTSHIHFESSKTPIRSIEQSRCGQFFSGTLWNQIFRRELLVKHMHDIFPTNYSEDTYIIWHIYAHAHSISFVSRPLYHYDKRNQKSLMHIRIVSKDAWLEQKRNLVCIEQKRYSCSRDYNLALYYFMFWRKYEYLDAFDTPWEFYNTFREASLYILFFPGMTIVNRLKIFLINNFYPLFWMYKKCNL